MKPNMKNYKIGAVVVCKPAFGGEFDAHIHGFALNCVGETILVVQKPKLANPSSGFAIATYDYYLIHPSHVTLL